MEITLDIIVRQAIEAGAIGTIHRQGVVVGIGRGGIRHNHSIPVIDFEFRQGKSQVVAVGLLIAHGAHNCHADFIGCYSRSEQFRCELVILNTIVVLCYTGQAINTR